MKATDRVMVTLVTGFVAIGTVTLALAVVGAARPVVVLPAAACVWAALLWAWSRPPRATAGPVADQVAERVAGRRPHPLLLAAGVAVILLSTAHNVSHQGEYVITDRDSGIYVVGGKWIADNGTLWVDSGVGADVLAVDGVAVAGGGQTDADVDGRLQIQGAHLFHSLLAVGEWVAGAAGSAAMPGLIGGLALAALFWLALKVVPDWAAVMVVTALAVDLAWLYTVRASLSEPLLLLISAGGAALLIDATEAWPRRPWRLAVAGFVAATALTARVDAGAVLLAFPLLVAWVVRRQGPGSRPLAALGWWGAGAAAPLLLAVVDLTLRSPRYLHDLRSEVVRVVAAVVAAVLVAVVVALSGTDSGRVRVERVGTRLRPLVPRLAAGAAVVVVALAAFAWFVRPELGPDRGHRGGQGWRIMETIQVHEGLDPDGRRTYAERVLDRIRWYAGPMTIAAGATGLAILAWRLVSDRIRPAQLVVAGLVTPYLLMYLYLPSVDADHPWFIRRYVPTAIPGLLIFAGVAAATLVDWKRIARPLGHIGAAAIVVGCVAWPLESSWSLRAISWQAGGRDGVERLCADFAPGSVAVLTADDRIGLTILPAIRSYCSVEAVAVDPRLVAADGAPVVAGVVDAVAARGRGGLVEVVAPSTEVLAVVAPDATDLREVVVLDTTQLGTTIGQIPSHIGPRRLTVWIGTVRTSSP